ERPSLKLQAVVMPQKPQRLPRLYLLPQPHLQLLDLVGKLVGPLALMFFMMRRDADRDLVDEITLGYAGDLGPGQAAHLQLVLEGLVVARQLVPVVVELDLSR